jgi:hypothetical protein
MESFKPLSSMEKKRALLRPFDHAWRLVERADGHETLG